MTLGEDLELWFSICFALLAIARFVFKAYKSKWRKLSDIFGNDLTLHYLVSFAIIALALYFTKSPGG